jgi:hypothetical protein
MSTPEEEERAISQVRQFLFDLMDASVTPRVPKYIRQRARKVSKHYPLLPSDGVSYEEHRERMIAENWRRKDATHLRERQ